MEMKRSRRIKGDKANYRELVQCRLPRSKRKATTKTNDDLYPIEIVSDASEEQGAGSTGSRVKVHYIGYSEEYDEWRDKEDIEDLTDTDNLPVHLPSVYSPYSLYKDLALRIKKSLTCARASPNAKIVLPFDSLSFNGGLKLAGVPSRKQGGVQHYTIKSYEDLNELLGCNWHVRGINCNGDYGYVLMETVEFYFTKCRNVVEYLPPTFNNPNIQCSRIDAGYQLTFTFTTGYGNASTFGKDNKNFL